MNHEEVTRFCKAVEVLGRITRAQIRVEGMKAENMIRQRRDESIAYHEDNFEAIILEEGIDHNSVVERLFHG
jgi:hypothetical protein